MQNTLRLIEQMLKAVAEDGYDCCSANRTRNGDPVLRAYFSRKFYNLTNKISEVNIPDSAGDFRMMSRPMVNAILAMGEVQRFSKGIFSWVGFETKWSFWKLFMYAVDGITAFSTFPLRIASLLSFIYFIMDVF